MPHDLAERILDQALGYLKLASSKPEGHYSPSPLVDIGWHTFILYTREYGKFCRDLTGGRFIHHEPTDEEGVPNLSSGPLGTMQAMRELGIVVDEPLWAHMHAGDCSNCNGGQGCQCGSRATTDQAFALDHSPLTRNRSRVSGALSISW